jgi:2-keto-4-pentenoate hydratase/2-oxohepta-3-ene-1,7-dioic acid hydratase in catechol pathway
MRLSTLTRDGKSFVAVRTAVGLVDLSLAEPGAPKDIQSILQGGSEALAGIKAAVAAAPREALLDPEKVTWAPLIAHPGKIICVGLNYRDHTIESGFVQPNYPTLFARFSSSLVAHREPIVRPQLSDQLDFEGELAVIIGTGGRRISRAQALDHVAGYSLFNDASVRDYQTKSPQWTVGKNFDGTGAFGPELVTADELPAGAAGLQLTTRLNGNVVQNASTNDLVFDVVDLITIISEAISLHPGDVIVSGTPAGVGLARKPPLWMKPGDVVEVEVEGVGILSNAIVDDVSLGVAA